MIASNKVNATILMLVSSLIFSPYAFSTEDDNFILEILGSVLPAALKITSKSELVRCKKDEEVVRHQRRLTCATKGFNRQDNYYVLFIDEGQVPVDTPPLVATYADGAPPLSDVVCGSNASIIGPTIITQSDIPADTIPNLQTRIDIEKGNKKIPVFYKITVKNGSFLGDITLQFSLYCVKK
jgi:hypothetical protein